MNRPVQFLDATAEQVPEQLFPFALVRRASVELDAFESLAFDQTPNLLDELLDARARLATIASSVTADLHEAVAKDGGTRIGELIRLKRDVFNGRVANDERLTAGRRALAALSGAAVARIDEWLALRRRVEELERSAKAACRAEFTARRVRLKALAAERNFLCSIYMASPSAMRRLQDYLDSPTDAGSKKLRKAELAAARYLSRAAMKTSPFSGFCTTGLLRVTDLSTASGEPVAPPSTRLSLNETLFRDLATGLWADPLLKRFLPVRINPNIARTREGLLLLDRPCEAVPGEASPFRGLRETFRHMACPQNLALLIERLAGRGTFAGHDGLLSVLEPVLGNREKAVEVLDLLERNGLLLASCDAGGATGGSFAKTLSGIRETGGASDVLARLGELSRDVDRLLSEPGARREWECRADTLTQVNERLGRIFAGSPLEARVGNQADNVFEDVFVPRETVSLGLLEPALRDMLRVYSLTAILDRNVFHRRTLAEMLDREYGGRPMPLLEAAAAYRQLVSRAASSGGDAGFNPYQLSDLDCLLDLKRELARGLREKTASCGEQADFTADFFAGFTGRMPECAQGERMLTFFCQPLLKNSSLHLVVNQFFNGPLALIGRFLAASGQNEEAVRAAAGRYLRSGTDRDAQIVDVDASFAFNGNLRPPLTEERIDYLGTREGIKLGELRLGLRDGMAIELIDARGRSIKPFYLGVMSPILRPPVLRLLTSLSQSACLDPRTLLLEQAASSNNEGIAVIPRLSHGRCVFGYRTWLMRAEQIPPRARYREEHRYWEAVESWRESHGVPRHVFLREDLGFFAAVTGEGAGSMRSRKPQYIDFRNGFLLRLFEKIVAASRGLLILEEALPEPGQWRAAGENRVSELVLDCRV